MNETGSTDARKVLMQTVATRQRWLLALAAFYLLAAFLTGATEAPLAHVFLFAQVALIIGCTVCVWLVTSLILGPVGRVVITLLSLVPMANVVVWLMVILRATGFIMRHQRPHGVPEDVDPPDTVRREPD